MDGEDLSKFAMALETLAIKSVGDMGGDGPEGEGLNGLGPICLRSPGLCDTKA